MRVAARRLGDTCEVHVCAGVPGGGGKEQTRGPVTYHFLPVGLGNRIRNRLRRFTVFDRPGKPLFASPFYYSDYSARVSQVLRRIRPDIIHVLNFSQFVPVFRRKIPSSKIVLHMQCEWLTQLDQAMIERRLAIPAPDLPIEHLRSLTSPAPRRRPQPSHDDLRVADSRARLRPLMDIARRWFVIFPPLIFILTPLAAAAQQARRVPVIGLLAPMNPAARHCGEGPLGEAFRRGAARREDEDGAEILGERPGHQARPVAADARWDVVVQVVRVNFLQGHRALVVFDQEGVAAQTPQPFHHVVRIGHAAAQEQELGRGRRHRQGKLVVQAAVGVAEHLVFVHHQQVGAFALDDYDFKNPRGLLGVAAKRLQPHAQAEHEVFDYPGEYRVTSKDGGGEHYVDARIDELHSEFDRAEAELGKDVMAEYRRLATELENTWAA